MSKGWQAERPSTGLESEARGTSEVGSGTDEEDEREDASGGAHGGTA